MTVKTSGREGDISRVSGTAVANLEGEAWKATAVDLGFTSGRCTACDGPAMRAPSERWWHVGEPCAIRSGVMFRPGDGPARFEVT